MNETSHRINAFKSSVVSNLLDARDFIDWNSVEYELNKQRPAISALQETVNTSTLDSDSLSALLERNPQVYPLLLSLIAFNASGSQISKWGLPENVPKSKNELQRLAQNLSHIGVQNLFPRDTDVEALARIAEIYKDSFKRRFRSGNKFEHSVAKIVREAASLASEEIGTKIQVVNPSVLRDTRVSRFLEHVILQDAKPIAAVATVFQQQTGGRQQRELSVTYPHLQENLSAFGVSLILIADGPGIQDTSERALYALFEGVRFPLTIAQANKGMLSRAIIDASIDPEVATIESATLDSLISSALDERGSISAADLPVRQKEAELAIARYRELHPELDIELSPDGTDLTWREPSRVITARELARRFVPAKAAELFGRLIGSLGATLVHDNTFDDIVVDLEQEAPFSDKLFVRAAEQDFDQSLARSTAQTSMEVTPNSRVAVLLVPTELSTTEKTAHRRAQPLRAVSIIVFPPSLLLKASRAANPRTIIVDEILRQADLTKVSPYVLANATPPQMFFGRDQEAATTLSSIANSSVAILGSRRIGKTSLLKRLRSDLNDAGFSPYFGDCQTVRTWDDFAKVALREWGAKAPPEFKPSNLVDITEQLKRSSPGAVVIILDEIDQLLLWDLEHDEDSVPEAFFRSCRAISQAGEAQFIFSGERAIAKKIWDPQSPHWNFCRPISLTQLQRRDALDLLLSPLAGLGIEVIEPAKFSELVWLYTSGHPQIVQQLGDRLIRSLDQQRQSGALELSPENLNDTAQTYEFAEHYVTTYLGQATPLEREIAGQLRDTAQSSSEVRSRARSSGLECSEDEFDMAVRMLQLYGIITVVGNEFHLKAEWFPSALSFFGERI